MRMWMVDPTIMCRQHLLGEHYELHVRGAYQAAQSRGRVCQRELD